MDRFFDLDGLGCPLHLPANDESVADRAGAYVRHWLRYASSQATCAESPNSPAATHPHTNTRRTPLPVGAAIFSTTMLTVAATLFYHPLALCHALPLHLDPKEAKGAKASPDRLVLHSPRSGRGDDRHHPIPRSRRRRPPLRRRRGVRLRDRPQGTHLPPSPAPRVLLDTLAVDC